MGGVQLGVEKPGSHEMGRLGFGSGFGVGVIIGTGTGSGSWWWTKKKRCAGGDAKLQ